MSNSEFLFKGKSRNLKDSVIGRFLDELAEHISLSDYPWLKHACNRWQEDWKTMPPGCKDIDLDAVIIDSNRRHIFEEKVREIQESISERSIEQELNRILELIDVK